MAAPVTGPVEVASGVVREDDNGTAQCGFRDSAGRHGTRILRERSHGVHCAGRSGDDRRQSDHLAIERRSHLHGHEHWWSNSRRHDSEPRRGQPVHRGRLHVRDAESWSKLYHHRSVLTIQSRGIYRCSGDQLVTSHNQRAVFRHRHLGRDPNNRGNRRAPSDGGPPPTAWRYADDVASAESANAPENADQLTWNSPVVWRLRLS